MLDGLAPLRFRYLLLQRDSLTLLDLPSIPGIPKFAGFTEIIYSVLIVGYLLQTILRRKYFGPKKI